MRGRNNNNRNNKGPNPLTRSYESNGPDVKIRGTAQHIAEKYSQLARDATASGDPVAAENYFQHAEHYYRIIAAAQEQLREQYGYQRFDDEGDEEGFAGERSEIGNGENLDPSFQPQPYEQRPEPRSEQRPETERQQRFDRNERFPRGEQRPERQNWSDRPDRGERQDRGERRDRFQQRDRNPRQDYPRQDYQRSEGPRSDQSGEDTRPERPNRYERDRNDRGDFRRDHRRTEDGPDEATGLPAFLTNAVRQPVATHEEDVSPANTETERFGADTEELAPRLRRPRRTRREMEEARAAAENADTDTPKTSAAE